MAPSTPLTLARPAHDARRAVIARIAVAAPARSPVHAVHAIVRRVDDRESA